MELKVYTDGGAIGNPGPAAISFVIYQDNKIFLQYSEKIGSSTNNFAEYSALIKAQEKIKELLSRLNNVTKITFFSDSALMVNQLNGLFKVKDATIREFVMKARILEQEIKIPIVYKNIPRENNTLADSLIKKQLR